MAIKNGTVNPLNVLEIRKSKFPARHFHYTKVFRYSPSLVQQIDNWIYNNLNSRYYVGQGLDLVDNTIIYVTKIGFESEKELSFFRLACPHLA
jgi:hypothetical protein